jgi:hypothetical protein
MPILLPTEICKGTDERGLALIPITREQLGGLVAFFGGSVVSAMPNLQARRYETAQALQDDLRNVATGNWADLPALVEFEALLEGLVFGVLHLRVVDLLALGFLTTRSERYMALLSDRTGEVVGATDPECLVFRPADCKEDNWRQLLADTATIRNRPEGMCARALLNRFKRNLIPFWQPQTVLWMRALDAYLDHRKLADEPNESTLRSGWKQTGPLLLRDNHSDKERFARCFFPVYQKGYLQKARTALGGTYVADRENHRVLLKVGAQECGWIRAPRMAGVPDESSLLLGEGTLEIAENAPERSDAQPDYGQLRGCVQSLCGVINFSDPGILDRVTREEPHSFPDIVRVPLLLDGWAAVHNLRPMQGARPFGSAFAQRASEAGLQQVPTAPAGLQSGILVKEPDSLYFVEVVGGQPIFYVERYKSIESGELLLLAEVLWLLFSGQARVEGDRVMKGEATILAMEQERLEPRLGLTCTVFDSNLANRPLPFLFQMWAVACSSADLLRAAVARWFEVTNSNLQLPAAPGPLKDFRGSRVALGRYQWYRAPGMGAVA